MIPPPPAALSRGDIAGYVDALFTVYLVLLLARIVLSWVRQFRGMPSNRVLDPVVGFIEESTDPYLNVFRRVVPPVGGRGLALDLSPMLAIFALLIAQRIVVGLIEG